MSRSEAAIQSYNEEGARMASFGVASSLAARTLQLAHNRRYLAMYAVGPS